MKDLLFLFQSFNLFLIIYVLVILDALVTISKAIIEKDFEWSYFPHFLYKILRYTGLLMVANIVEYVSTFSGYNLNEIGIITVFFSLLATELGSLQTKLLPEKTRNYEG